MARSNLFAAVANSISVARRAYSASPKPGAGIRGRRSGAALVGEEDVKKVGLGAESSSWVPDPVTGYYRPADRATDVDVADLRRILLTKKLRQH